MTVFEPDATSELPLDQPQSFAPPPSSDKLSEGAHSYVLRFTGITVLYNLSTATMQAPTIKKI